MEGCDGSGSPARTGVLLYCLCSGSSGAQACRGGTPGTARGPQGGAGGGDSPETSPPSEGLRRPQARVGARLAAAHRPPRVALAGAAAPPRRALEAGARAGDTEPPGSWKRAGPRSRWPSGASREVKDAAAPVPVPHRDPGSPSTLARGAPLPLGSWAPAPGGAGADSPPCR